MLSALMSMTNALSTDRGESHKALQGVTPATEAVAEILRPTLEVVFADPAVEIEFWDWSSVGYCDGPGRIRVNSIDALRRILWSPDELGLARAYVTGELDVTGSIVEILPTIRADGSLSRWRRAAAAPGMLAALRRLGGVGHAPPVPAEELLPRGRRHSLRRDRQAIRHHYDVGIEFYELVLGPAMTYSCARFAEPTTTLFEAQAAKHDLICRKLGLGEAGFVEASHGRRTRLLDVGCGWGSMALHAASNYDVEVVGVTISEEQAAYARRRVKQAGLDDRVEIRIQDYREVTDGPFDAVSSIGMSEPVGSELLDTYFERLLSLVRPGGRVLNHAISKVGGSRLGRRSFVYRYVFPDGELIDVGESLLAMERAGFEIRDVENLREHYATTLRRWVANLEARWDDAVSLVGERRARVWLLYMSGSINGFDDGGLQLHQVLGVRNASDGTSGVPPTRCGWA